MFRRIVEDYESKLAALDPGVTGPAAAAKAEHERFAGGDERFKLRLRKLTLADGTSLDVLLEGNTIGSVTVRKGRAEFIIEARRGGIVPRVKEGDRISVARAGVPLFAGVFQPD